MQVLPPGALTELEVHFKLGASLKPGAVPVYGIRPDFIGGPADFFKPEDILGK